MVTSAKESETVEITAERELAGEIARAKAGGKRIILVSDGIRYQIEAIDQEEAHRTSSRSDRDPWADYDPENVRKAVEAAAGSISVKEAERMKEYVYAAREAGTRPPNRP